MISSHVLGVGLAMIAALGLGTQVVLIRKGTDTGRATDSVFIVTSVNLVILLPTVTVLYYPEFHVNTYAILSFIGAGIVGTLFGRLCKYTSIHRIGASRTAPIVASNVVFGAIIAVLVLDEMLTMLNLLAILLIVSGVAIISWETSHDNPQNLSRKQLLIGLALPFLAALFYGAEPTFAKVGLEYGTPFLVGVLIKTVAAFLGFTLYLRFAGLLPSASDLTSASNKWYIAAGVASTVFVVFFYAALSVAPVVVVYPIIPTNLLFVLVLSAIFLPGRLETVTWKLVGSSALIVVGVIIISLYG